MQRLFAAFSSTAGVEKDESEAAQAHGQGTRRVVVVEA
jgi:hypothetical protein